MRDFSTDPMSNAWKELGQQFKFQSQLIQLALSPSWLALFQLAPLSVGTLSHSDHDDSGWRHYLQGGKNDIHGKKTLQFFSYRFIMNQILFLRNKNEIKNGPRGHARPTEKGSRGQIRKFFDFFFK